MVKLFHFFCVYKTLSRVADYLETPNTNAERSVNKHDEEIGNRNNRICSKIEKASKPFIYIALNAFHQIIKVVKKNGEKMKKYLVMLAVVMAGLFALSACEGSQEPAVIEDPIAVVENDVEAQDVDDAVDPEDDGYDCEEEDNYYEEEENFTENISTRDALQEYVAERGEGIAGGFEARDMTNFATVEVAGDNAVSISITLEDEFVQSLAITLDFLLAVLEEEIDSVMPIFSQEAGNVGDSLGIEDFHFIIKFLLSTGDALLWRNIYSNEVMGDVMTDFSFLEMEIPEATQTTVGDVTTIEFDGVTVSLGEPIVMTSDDFRSEFPDWNFDLGTHYRWLLIYAEITNNTTEYVNFGNRPFLITDELEDLSWQSTSIDRLNGTGFDADAVIAPEETISGYVPFIVTRHSGNFEIDVRPLFEGQLGSPFAGRFVFNFDVDMD